MEKKELTRNLRLGLFVIASALLLIISLYMIGSKRNLFGPSFQIKAMFYNVNGLVAGNNVRYSGIDVGTVSRVEIINDTSVMVVMLLNKDMQKFIKKNSVASIGTDGLMGNKIVSIATVTAPSRAVSEGDTVNSLKPIDTDAVMRTLNSTNENVEAISEDLRNMTKKLNSRNTLWSLLMDTAISESVKQALANIKLSSNTTAQLTGDLSQIVASIRQGKGTVGALLLDTSISGQIRQSIVNIQMTGKNSAIATGDLKELTERIKRGQGAAGALIMDTTLSPRIIKTIENIQKGTDNFNQNMEALKQVPFIRRYFKKTKTAAEK